LKYCTDACKEKYKSEPVVPYVCRNHVHKRSEFNALLRG
jgi:hypothetical protein